MMIPTVLSIAASDSSGAAGMQADLKTFEARQVYGLSVLTAITAQDASGVKAIQVVEASFVAQQIKVLVADIAINSVKTGLLLRLDIIEAINVNLPPTNLIVDPVLVAGDGRVLVDAAAIAVYKTALFPRALIITPNLDEARLLSGLPITDVAGMREAARRLYDFGPRYVLIKGGHLDSAELIDLLYDGSTFQEFHAERLPIDNPRGVGCTFAACIAAEVAKGHNLPQAVGIAKQYVTATLKAALDWQIGHGRATLFHSTGRPPLFES